METVRHALRGDFWALFSVIGVGTLICYTALGTSIALRGVWSLNGTTGVILYGVPWKRLVVNVLNGMNVHGAHWLLLFR